ncbi:MAG: histidine--tRNA ligase [Proteobacteria bacterium]|jgi:histidyl-tRNA synthetase|nr:histidine--tRNA ligase [Alphaproteobacteria bacterium]NCC03860.1 histidine--tRNA ligase [Pseudomonadota bacterium]
MSLIKPRIPSGTLELLPRNQMVFQHMLDVIRRGYERFGFVQVETPVFEHKDILLTKSGGETEKQVYFVQSTGSLAQGYEPDMALHFDLTVPLARYVAMRERELAFPFRRYQIQRSYRGERPQKGRAREFYQCDIDVIGKDKLDPSYDAELPAIIVEIFTELGLKEFTIHFSNRKILLGLLQAWGVADFETQTLIVREIDKLDKIGIEKVRESVLELGLAPEATDKLLALIVLRGTKEEVLEALRALKVETLAFVEGVHELEVMVSSLRALGVPEERTRINLAIARGLDYYTGTVYETLLDKYPEIGSICSGGRYDNLASMYCKSKLPGVGLSIGATRLYELLESLNMLPPVPHTTRVLIAQQDESLGREYLSLAAMLRKSGLTVENYLEPSKLDKQLKYADKAGIPYIVIYGVEEKARGTVLLKDMASKQQSEVKVAELADVIKGLTPPSVLN